MTNNNNKYIYGFLGFSLLAVFGYFGTGHSGNDNSDSISLEITDNNNTVESIGVTAEKIIPHDGEEVIVTAETPSE